MTEYLDLKTNNYQDIKELFQVTAQTTRQSLNCDRVIVYDAGELPQALILAESVDAKYSSILGKTIKDPFLDGSYLEMYCYGMSVSIDNIQTTDAHKTDIAELEKLEIKSQMIAPISVGNELLAFLVAHQCSKPQPWNFDAVDFLAEQASSVSLALSNITDTEKSQDFNFIKQIADSQDNKDYRHQEQKSINLENKNSLFTDVINKITNATDQADILNTTVAAVSELLKCDRVLVYSLEQDNYGVVVAESVAAGLTKALGKTIDDPCFAARYLEKYRNGRVRAWDNIYAEDITPCYLEQLEALGVKAHLVAPIIRESQLFGLLIAHQCFETRSWQEQEINWITEIANQVGIMLEYNKIFIDNEQEEQQLADVTNQIIDQKNWTEHFTNAIQQIRKSLKTGDIIASSVREVRKILNCDRVLIYGLSRNNYGKIVAESVAAGWTEGIGKIIKDPCFEARYLEKYRDGRVRVWNNIYEAGLTQCHIEQLAELEVKANLVVPIINDQKLFGLLVAQQCSGTRQWQQNEIYWLTQIATQIGFALENAQLLADAQRLRQQAEESRKWSEYFTDVIHQIRQSPRTKDILRASVREVRRILNCDRVLIYSLNEDNYGVVVAESVTHGWTRAEGKVIKDPCFEARYLAKYRDGRVRVWNDIYQAGMSSCHIEQLEQLEVKANLVIPIIKEKQLFGLLVAQQCSNTREWHQSEVDWLTKIATQVGYALDNAKLLEQIDQSTKDSQAILDRAVNNSSNIQQTVNNVTKVFEGLGHSCQQLSETIATLKDLSKQIAQQSMTITRSLNFSQVESSNQDFINDISDRIFTLMQELFEATAKIDPLFTNIKTEVLEKTIALELETQQLNSGVEEFQIARENLDRVVALNHEMSNLIDNISKSLEDQIQNSTFTRDSVQKVVNIAERISEQSVSMTQFFNQLNFTSSKS
ncbi:GAF domain-containing protein [Pleurocapsa sp. PCC 7319]|uniref:GAF domain-containing protein n=1 Tax=Pleurocapsa sp. PCC 7319 TaxID=118161 RepID=UPI0003488F2E|nr:GAF domain-containing protein [Pleurocapsa sp. PCC 7319]